MCDQAAIQTKFDSLRGALDERLRRLWAAAEARALGCGGIRRVAAITGLSRTTIRAGLRELEQPDLPSRRTRRPGAGRKPRAPPQPGIVRDLEALIDPVAAGNFSSPLRWTCKTIRQLALELQARGHRVGPCQLAQLLRQLGYRLLAPRQPRQGAFHPQRDAQLAHVNSQVRVFQQCHQVVVAVGISKKEFCSAAPLPGCALPPAESSAEGIPASPCPAPGPDLPEARLEAADEPGWIRVTPDADTAAFAVEALQQWWRHVGSLLLPSADQLLILTDAGSRNAAFGCSWQSAFAALGRRHRLADRRRLLAACHSQMAEDRPPDGPPGYVARAGPAASASASGDSADWRPFSNCVSARTGGG